MGEIGWNAGDPDPIMAAEEAVRFFKLYTRVPPVPFPPERLEFIRLHILTHINRSMPEIVEFAFEADGAKSQLVRPEPFVSYLESTYGPRGIVLNTHYFDFSKENLVKQDNHYILLVAPYFVSFGGRLLWSSTRTSH